VLPSNIFSSTFSAPNHSAKSKSLFFKSPGFPLRVAAIVVLVSEWCNQITSPHFKYYDVSGTYSEYTDILHYVWFSSSKAALISLLIISLGVPTSNFFLF